MRILLFGRNGQLGWELVRTLAPLGELVVLDYPEVDFAQPAALESLVRASRPQVVINAVAYTAVDRAEQEVGLARAINAQAPGELAGSCRRLGAALIHYSTDYVFDGMKGTPYVEEDAANPLNVYGLTKLEGEQAIAAEGGAWLVLRTSWVYSLRRDSFVTRVLQWSRAQSELRVVTDQVGSPTWARMLAEATALLLAQAGEDPAAYLGERRGVYHLAGEGAASRLEWARAVLEYDPRAEEQRVKEVLPGLTAEFPTPAKRPLFTALDCSKFARTFGLRLPGWREALKMAMEEKHLSLG